MDKQISPLLQQSQQFSACLKAEEAQVLWAPVRHHSTACSHYLLQWLDQQQPDEVLIEGPVDFNEQVDAITSEEVQPPIALYGDGMLFPMANNSPEYQALCWAKRHGKPVRFIDLPLKQKANNRTEQATPLSAQHEASLQHSDYVRRLVAQLGYRDADELWERQFELREFVSPQAFFQQVFDYCAASRLTHSEDAIVDTGDAEREAFMRRCIDDVVSTGVRCCVVTGGFHTPALLDFATAVKSRRYSGQEPSWLLRYSDDRLDALNGYSAGMPAPKFYDHLYRYRRSGEAAQLFELLSAIIDDLSSGEKPLVLNTVMKRALCDQAAALAELRQHAYPGLYDVKDAVISVLLKRSRTESDELLQQVHCLLAGNRLGQVKASALQVPIIAELYNTLKRARFKLENTSETNTSFNLYRIDQAAQQRRLWLYRCQFLGLEFAYKSAGPNWEAGTDLERQTEEWRYAWTPRVEANLIDRSLLCPDLTRLLQLKIDQALAEAAESLEATQRLFVYLVNMDCLANAQLVWSQLNIVLKTSTKPSELVQLITLFLRLYRFQKTVFEAYQQSFKQLLQTAWQQLMFCLPSIAKEPEKDALKLLVQARELSRELHDEQGEDSLQGWQEQWQSRLQWMLSHGQLTPCLHYACRALLIDLGDCEEQKRQLFADLEQLLILDMTHAYEALLGIVTVLPHWVLGRDEQLLKLLNRFMFEWEDPQFEQVLPDLRLLFSHFSPKQIEKLAQKIGQLNQWQTELTVFDTELNETEVLQAQASHSRLLTHLQQEGLSHWLEAADE